MTESTKPIDKFYADLFFKTIEKMIVFEGQKIIISLLVGTEIEVVIE